MTTLKSKATDAFVDEDYELALSLYDQVSCAALCPTTLRCYLYLSYQDQQQVYVGRFLETS